IVAGMHPETDENWLTQVILDSDQRVVGYVLTARARYGNQFGLRGLALDEGMAMTAVLPPVLRALAAQAPVMRAPHPRTQPATVIGLGLGRTHPAYDALSPSAPVVTLPPYAWYVRVADLPALVTHIAPALERRLAGSIVEGYTGEVKLSFYRGGLRLVFAAGRLTTAEDWAPGAWDAGNAGFPPLVFLQLLFGHHSLAALQAIYPDIWVNDAVRPLLEALFPARLSWVLPLD
ncbi:MAG TPA: GNAT family N-acetyltransferase, partial [Ktedonobacterales bacterium]|nr:GNAT family N-acetyltransferase [Ktedonobacterales bacterium]